MAGDLQVWVQRALADPSALQAWTAEDVADIRCRVDDKTDRARVGEREAREDLHRAAYRAFIARYALPWRTGPIDPAHPLLSTFLWSYISAVRRDAEAEHRALLDAAPRDDIDAYIDWVTDVVRVHRSNVSHPLFDFLANQASYEHLRTFIFQETPFDIHFADILCCLLPGIHGEVKQEIAANFWDEMGNGDLGRHHRSLRLNMTGELSLDPQAHEQDVDAFVLEEIELANAYFLASVDRAQVPMLLGMLLATESMVPGRLERQIEGWRRVGIADVDMTYLLEHTVVDVEHATGWLDHVIRPVLRDDPSMVTPITLGVGIRLDLAARVCDRLYADLTTVVDLDARELPPAEGVLR